MNKYTPNELIEAVLYDKHRIKSYINYLKVLWKIKRSTPDYNELLLIYDFLEQLNFAYFHCLDKDNHLFIYNSSDTDKKKKDNKALHYKDDSVDIIIYLKPDNIITIVVKRKMGFKETHITFSDGNAKINNELEEQLFINCIHLIMDELYQMIRKYRKFGRMGLLC